ncbi:MAG: hypothetical protein V7725_01155 [Porticoccus sp.]
MKKYLRSTGYSFCQLGVITVSTALALSMEAFADDLASKATNPIGDMIQVQMQYQHSPDVWNLDGHSDAAIVQPVVPVDLPFEWMPKMITRTTVPYVTTPKLPGVGSVDGLGDTVVLAFGLPELGLKGQMFGFGPALGLDTASEDETGSGRWSAGPAAVYINLQTKGMMWGLMSYGLWDYAGDDDREHVAQINIQPVLNKFFANGWYLGLQDVPWTFDDNTNKWNIPIGPRAGKVVHFGSQAVNIFGGAYYNAEDTDGTGKWTYKLSFSFLFPEKTVSPP